MQGNQVSTVSAEIGGKTLTIESGLMAKQSAGSVVVRLGDTMVLTAVNCSTPRADLGFFPLTVDYREKVYAAGKIPGGFFKREGRPTIKEVLTMRVTDRSIRPLFPEGFNDEVQVMSTVISADQENDPDILSMIGAFAALHISQIPFAGPLGAARIGHIGGKLVVNPTNNELKAPDSKLDLIVAGNQDFIAMVESGAKELDEETMVEALELGQKISAQVAGMCDELRTKTGSREKTEFTPAEVDTALRAKVAEKYSEKITAAIQVLGKLTRKEGEKALKKEIVEDFTAGIEDEDEKLRVESEVKAGYEETSKKIERAMILDGKRTDGRGSKDIRPITIQLGVLPRAHGSALFTRGETQALVAATLGTADDEQIIDGLNEEYKKSFLLHYNFPPFSVGEVKPIRGTSRREYGHGALAERSLETIVPGKEKFPYTIRVVSDILESNGSSSMASVCGGTLSMMDAGVPIKQPVAGVAMGLIKEGDRYAVLTDIQGGEDHNGDMDFKVAGTGVGITGLQMDIKIKGVSKQIMTEALGQAREARMSILKSMLQAISAPRSEVSTYAPRMEQLKIKSDKIGLLIGPGGKNIKKLQADFKVNIAVLDDDGNVQVAGTDNEMVKKAMETIKTMCSDPEVGQIYSGKVVSVRDFGAFVEIAPGQEGLVHVSEWEDGYIDKMGSVAKVGDATDVKVINIDDSGRVKLSRKQALKGKPAEVGASGGDKKD